MNKSIETILIVKLSSIGDVIHSLPLLEVLKGRFPSAKIDWVVEEDASGLLEGHPCINRLFVFPRKSWLKRFIKKNECVTVGKEISSFVRQIRHQKYDIVIDHQGLFRSGMLTFLARGKRKIGLDGSREGSSIFFTEKVTFPDPDMHALDRYLCIARYLGADNFTWEGMIPVCDKDKKRVRYLLKNIIDSDILIAINPMARWDSKLWELDRFACLADRIKDVFGAEVVFTGSKNDKAAIEDILSTMRTKALNLAGKTNLKELAYLYQRCNIVISTDTGPMQVAAAMRNPVVIGLFGPTSPLKTGPYGEKHKVIRAHMDCSPCFKKKCKDMSCMKEITVDIVFDSVKKIINT